jgi:dienelactone hydrolase
VMEVVPSLPNHTVYRPENLAAVKGKLPIIAFGNGACGNAGNAFQYFLSEIASHGFLVVANGPIDPNIPTRAQMQQLAQSMAKSSKVEPGGAAGQAPRIPLGGSKTSQMYETMDWAKIQNEDKTNPYHTKLDLSAIAVMGQSCGGLQALEAASDPRIKTVVVLNSGIIRDMSVIEKLSAPKPPPFVLPGSIESLGKLHSPTLYLVGGDKDMAYPNAQADFADIKGVPLFKANLDVGHGGTFMEPHGGKFAEITTQWLNWQLKGDQKAGQMFVGDKCGLCSQTEWKVERKNLK